MPTTESPPTALGVHASFAVSPPNTYGASPALRTVLPSQTKICPGGVTLPSLGLRRGLHLLSSHFMFSREEIGVGGGLP
jgi:hypothetical protein